ncbi:MAG: hypothetical protein KHX55_01630 [Proteobacteria bacterium]|nr:hypothetical protein [Pseudomonadota bacterium]
MYYNDEEEKRRQQTAQYINTPYGPARNSALGQEGTAAANAYEVENPPSEKPDYWGVAKNYSPQLGFLQKKGSAFGNVIQTYNSFSDDKIHNDKYKHATVSCAGAQGNPLDMVLTTVGGMAKEGIDITRKSVSKALGNNQYGSYTDILNDSREDLKADFQGIKQGMQHPDENCEEWMKKYYYPYWK